MNFADEFLVDDSLIFCYFLEGEFATNIFRFESHSCSLVSPSLVCLNFFKYVWLVHIGAQLEFSVLVDLGLLV